MYKFSLKQEKEIILDYMILKKLINTSKKWGVHYSVIKRILKKYNKKEFSRKKIFSNIDVKNIIKLYKKKESLSKIAQCFFTNKWT